MNIVNSDVDRLQKICSGCEAQYTEGEYLFGSNIGTQEPWIKLAGLAPQGSDAKITNNLAPRLDPDVDWVQIRTTRAAQVLNAKTYIIQQLCNNPSAQREIGDVDLSTLNKEKVFSKLFNIKCQVSLDKKHLK